MSEKDRRTTYDAGSSTHRGFTAHAADDWAWLADEAAIDFPSLDGILGRMRKAFFGRDGGISSLSTEILLTPREAFHGVTIPLDVPLRQTCPVCGGRGEVWAEPCAVCAGTGDGLCSHLVQVSVPPGVRHGTRLHVNVTLPYAPSTLVEIRVAIQ